MSTELALSAIIPTFRRPDSLDLCLSALMSAVELVHADQVEIMVTDDDPGGSAREVVGRYPNFVIWNQGPCKGPAANRNAGARRTRGNLLIFLDDDCVPHQNLLTAYLQSATENPSTDVFEGRIVAERKMRYAYEVCPVNEAGGSLWSANMAVRRSSFEALGGFDEQYPYAAMEDVDFCRRLQQASKVIRFCPQAWVTHPIEVRTGMRRQSRNRYSLLLFSEKHPEHIDDLRRNNSFVSMLRIVKQRVFKRSILQPFGSYVALVEELWSMFLTFRILSRPASIARKRIELGSALMNAHTERGL